jgi:hypothetical protein
MPDQPSVAPTTTIQEDLTTAGQRRVNIIWEGTQAAIAILVTIAFLYCEVTKVDSTAVKMGFMLVIGFYFSRTNHSAIGGIGLKPTQRYEGT